jgi:PAS domain S-box-containing protein
MRQEGQIVVKTRPAHALGTYQDHQHHLLAAAIKMTNIIFVIGIIVNSIWLPVVFWKTIIQNTAALIVILMGVMCSKLAHHGQLRKAVHIYLSSAVTLIVLITLNVGQHFILNVVLILTIFVLLSTFLETPKLAHLWGVISAIVYPAALTARIFGPFEELTLTSVDLAGLYAFPVINFMAIAFIGRGAAVRLSEALTKSENARSSLEQSNQSLRETQEELQTTNDRLQVELEERKRAEEALRTLHDELEQRVEERTAETAAANQQLRREVAQRKRSEEQLQESEERFRTICEHAPVMIGSFDEEGECLLWNRECVKNLGWSQAELEACDDPMALFYEDPAERDRVLASMQRSDGGFREYRVRAKDSTVRTQLWADFRLPSGAGISVGHDISERKRAEQALRAERDRLEAVTRSLGVGLAVIAKDFRTIWANETLLERFGEVTGKACYEAYNGRGEICPECGVREVFETGAGPVVHEQSGIDAEGKTTWSQIIASPIRDAAGEITAAVELVVPITERKEIEERLRFQKTLLEAQNEASIDGILVSDPAGTILSFNRRFADMWGIPEEILQTAEGRDLLGYFLERVEDPEGARAGLQRLHGHTDEESQREVRLKDGRILDRYSAPVRSRDGADYGRVWIYRDVTERERAEAALRQSEERFREMAETIREVFWLFDWVEQRVIYASPAYETIWGRSVEQLLEDYGEWGRSIHPEDVTSAEATFAEIAETGGGEPREYRIARPDGEVRWILDRGFAIGNEQGQVVRIAGIAEDITDLKRAEEERRRLEAKVQHAQKLESLGVMAGGIAHDFNNLLMAILGNAELALMRLAPEAPGRECVDHIVTAAQRAAELTNQMLAYSGQGRFLVGPTDLNRLVTEMGHLLEMAISKKAALQFHLADRLPAIEADASQIRQVVMNLITNASEALAEERGTIGVSTGVVQADEPYLSESELGDELPPRRYVALEVSDTGAGMDAETRERIFDPFFTTKFLGRGLGLAAVQGIVRGHHGAIRVYSEPGRGSTFKVLLPASAKAVRPEAPAAQVPRARGEGVTILVVDDDPAVRDVAEGILTASGYRVLTAADGREGVEVYRRHQEEIAVVVLDMSMPEMDGEEAFREIRRIRADARVVLSSGYNEQDATSRFAGKGLASFIQKPYRSAALLGRIQKILERS